MCPPQGATRLGCLWETVHWPGPHQPPECPGRQGGAAARRGGDPSPRLGSKPACSQPRPGGSRHSGFPQEPQPGLSPAARGKGSEVSAQRAALPGTPTTQPTCLPPECGQSVPEGKGGHAEGVTRLAGGSSRAAPPPARRSESWPSPGLVCSPEPQLLSLGNQEGLGAGDWNLRPSGSGLSYCLALGFHLPSISQGPTVHGEETLLDSSSAMIDHSWAERGRMGRGCPGGGATQRVWLLGGSPPATPTQCPHGCPRIQSGEPRRPYPPHRAPCPGGSQNRAAPEVRVPQLSPSGPRGQGRVPRSSGCGRPHSRGAGQNGENCTVFPNVQPAPGNPQN